MSGTDWRAMASDLRIDFYEPYDPQTNDRWAKDFPRRRIAKRIESLIADDRAELRTDATRWLQPTLPATPRGTGGGLIKATFIDLYRIRSDNWPYFSRQGTVTPLDAMLAAEDDDGIADVTHFGMFPGNVLVMIYNHFGPRANSLSRYLRDKLGVDVEFRSVARDDMLETLTNAGTVRRFHIRFAAQEAERIRASGSFGADAAALANEIPDTDVSIEFTMRGRAATGNPVSRVKQVAGQLLRSAASRALKTAAVEIGADDDYGRTLLNLLEDELTLTAPLPDGVASKRYVPEREAISVLRESYRTLRPTLERLVGVLEEASNRLADEPDLPPMPDEPG